MSDKVLTAFAITKLIVILLLGVFLVHANLTFEPRVSKEPTTKDRIERLEKQVAEIHHVVVGSKP